LIGECFELSEQLAEVQEVVQHVRSAEDAYVLKKSTVIGATAIGALIHMVVTSYLLVCC